MRDPYGEDSEPEKAAQQETKPAGTSRTSGPSRSSGSRSSVGAVMHLISVVVPPSHRQGKLPDACLRLCNGQESEATSAVFVLAVGGSQLAIHLFHLTVRALIQKPFSSGLGP